MQTTTITSFKNSLFLFVAAMLFGTALAQTTDTTFDYTGSLQSFTVPAGVTQLTIEAAGAQGGNSPLRNGGNGARLISNFAVVPSQTLQIIVGGAGGSGFLDGGGGGGATFVAVGSIGFADFAAPNVLLIAGAGGGASDINGSASNVLQDTASGPGGSSPPFFAGGGATAENNGAGAGGQAAINGAAGGSGSFLIAGGGFGGGGAANIGGGGGGGATGGNGGNIGGNSTSGQGGTSFSLDSLTTQFFSAGNSGNGFVKVSYTCPPPSFTSCPSDTTIYIDSCGGVVVNYNISIDSGCGLPPASLPGFTTVGSFGGNTYYLSNNTFTGPAAFNDATANGGFVATVNDAAENGFLSGVLSANGASSALIGYNDVTTEGSFEWQSGQTPGYTNWNPGEPNDFNGEDYVHLEFSGGWNDIPATSAYRYILERKGGFSQDDGLASSSVFPIGTTTNTFVMGDVNGNTDTCSFTVTVVDTVAPTVTCPSDTIVYTDSCGGTVVHFNQPAVNSGCGGFAPDPIPGFTTVGSFGGNTYYLSDSAFTGPDAFNDATANGGFVVTVNDAAENAFLTNSVNANGAGSVIIGYNDTASEGSFVWQSGQTPGHTNWSSGEPNNAGNEDFTVLTSSGGWNDISASSVLRYILERPGGFSQDAGLVSGSVFPIGITTNTFVVGRTWTAIRTPAPSR